MGQFGSAGSERWNDGDDGAQTRREVGWYSDLESGHGAAQSLTSALRMVLLDATADIAREQAHLAVTRREAANAAAREADRKRAAEAAETQRSQAIARDEAALLAMRERERRRAAERAEAWTRAAPWFYALLAIVVVLVVDTAIINSLAGQASSYVQEDPDNGFIRLIGYCLIPLFLADVPLIIVLVVVGVVTGSMVDGIRQRIRHR